jgi:hypothetical protein
MLSTLLLLASVAKPTEDYWMATLELAGYNIQPYDVVVAADKSVYVTGMATSGSIFHSFIVKYSETGALQWQRELGVGDVFAGGAQYAYGITLDSNQNVYVVGQSTSDSGAFIHSYTSSGTARWKRALGSGNDHFMGITTDSANNIYAVGFTQSSSLGLLVAKYNSSGVLQWQRNLGTGSDRGEGVGFDANGSIYAAGASISGSFFRPLLAKYNSSGTLQWQRTLNVEASSTRAYNVAATQNAAYFATTKTQSYITKYDTDGSLVWQQTLSGLAAGGYAPGIALDSLENSYLCIGRYIVKYDVNGSLAWQREIINASDFYAIKHLGTALYVVGINNAKAFIAKLPDNGGLTGTYGSFTYQASSLTASGGNATDATSSFAVTTPTLTDKISSIPDNAATLTSTKVDI